MRIKNLFILLLMLAAAVGCKKQPYACVPVSGKVTYEDGSLIPAERIRMTFISRAPPAERGIAPRAGSARVNCQTGTFDSAMTYVAGDGIIPGEHKVLIVCYVGNEMRTDLVGKEYADPKSTPLTVDSSKSPFELKVKKPGSPGP
jgi:hypothetical protein